MQAMRDVGSTDLTRGRSLTPETECGGRKRGGTGERNKQGWAWKKEDAGTKKGEIPQN